MYPVHLSRIQKLLCIYLCDAVFGLIYAYPRPIIGPSLILKVQLYISSAGIKLKETIRHEKNIKCMKSTKRPATQNISIEITCLRFCNHAEMLIKRFVCSLVEAEGRVSEDAQNRDLVLVRLRVDDSS